MRRALIYRGVDRSCFYSSKGRRSSPLGPAALRAGHLLAVVCLSFGTAVAAFLPESLERRIGNLFLFGLIPAIGFYAGGHILARLLMFSSELCEMILARCFRCAMLLVNYLMSWAGARVANLLGKLAPLPQKVYCSVHRRYWHVHTAIFHFSCLLIRSAARFIIRMQAASHQ